MNSSLSPSLSVFQLLPGILSSTPPILLKLIASLSLIAAYICIYSHKYICIYTNIYVYTHTYMCVLS